MTSKTIAAGMVLVLAGCAAGPAPAPPPPPTPVSLQTDCAYPAFVAQQPFSSGALVVHGGKLYRATHPNPGYIPSVSTYYWAEIFPFVPHRRYYEGDAVTYERRVYVAEHDNPAYLPTVSTYYWKLQGCPQ